jgi:hypothetical protein
LHQSFFPQSVDAGDTGGRGGRVARAQTAQIVTRRGAETYLRLLAEKLAAAGQKPAVVTEGSWLPDER